MKKRKFGMACLNITQGRYTGISHQYINAYDLAGMDTGIDRWRTWNDLEVIGVHPYATTGFANTVHFYDAENDVTIAMTHCNIIPDGCTVGHVFHSGDTIYYEGTKGQATGNHIHLEIGKGYQPSKVKAYNGGWGLKDFINIEDYFYIDQEYTTIKDDGGYSFSFEQGETQMIEKDEKTGVYGVDLSEHDKLSIDFEKLAKTAKYAILRVGFGKDLDGQHDECFLDFCKQCDKYGIKKGAYIYSYAETEQEARNEAKHIIRLCNEAGGDFPIGLFLDQEDKLQQNKSVNVNTRNVLAYIDEIWKTNYKAGYYTYHDFANSHVDMSQIVGNAIVWIADFGVNDGTYHAIETDFDYDIRQYTSTNNGRDFSSRAGLDQNLHFGYSNYVTEPVEEEKPNEDVEAMKHAIANLENQLEILNRQIKALGEENDAQDELIKDMDNRLSIAGNALLRKGE